MFVFLVFVFFFFVFFIMNSVFSFNLVKFSTISAFESGFQSIGKIQKSFSVQFFLVLLIFVIFDLEIVLLIGFLLSGSFSIFSFFFLMIFIAGSFYLEWFFNKLGWSM